VSSSAHDHPLGSQVQELIDRASIEARLVAYCRSVDRLDLPLLRDCYTSDGTDDRGLFTGSADQLVDYVARYLGSMEQTMHFLTNAAVSVDGAAARSEAYVLAFHRVKSQSAESGIADHWVGARYLDTWRKDADGCWRIATRQVVWDWTRTDPMTRTWTIPSTALLPSRGRQDPSYEHLRQPADGAPPAPPRFDQ
jgi:ketosteroid isomerase-like protein